MKKIKYVVSLALIKDNKVNLVSGQIKASSTKEAIGIAVAGYDKKLGSVLLSTAVRCDKQGFKFEIK